MQLEIIEGKGQGDHDCFGDVASSGLGLIDPVADEGALEGTSLHRGQGKFTD